MSGVPVCTTITFTFTLTGNRQQLISSVQGEDAKTTTTRHELCDAKSYSYRYR
jgi:hypothetical protein